MSDATNRQNCKGCIDKQSAITAYQLGNREAAEKIATLQADCQRWSAMYSRQADELVSVKAENERLKAQWEFRQRADYPNWGGVKIANTKIETQQELLDAAERLIQQGECLGGCGSPYGGHTGFAEQFDEIAVGEAYKAAVESIAALKARLAEVEQQLENSLVSLMNAAIDLANAEQRAEAAETRVRQLTDTCREALARFKAIRKGGEGVEHADPAYLVGNEDVISRLESAITTPPAAT